MCKCACVTSYEYSYKNKMWKINKIIEKEEKTYLWCALVPPSSYNKYYVCFLHQLLPEWPWRCCYWLWNIWAVINCHASVLKIIPLPHSMDLWTIEVPLLEIVDVGIFEDWLFYLATFIFKYKSITFPQYEKFLLGRYAWQ